MNDEAALKGGAGGTAPRMLDELVIGDVATLRALTDRQRLQIMEAFVRRGGEPRTVKEVARELGEAPTKLYYHVNMLEQHGLLIVADSRLVSGIVEKRYIPAARNFRVDRALLGDASAADPGAATDLGDALGNVLDTAAHELRAAVDAGLFAPNDGRSLVSLGTLRLTAEQAARVRESLAEIIQTGDSTDNDAGDYLLTVVFHPTPRSDS